MRSCRCSPAPVTGCATTPGRWPSCWVGSTGSTTESSPARAQSACDTARLDRRPSGADSSVLLALALGPLGLLELPHPGQRLGRVDVGHRPGRLVGEWAGVLLPAQWRLAQPFGQEGE